MNKITLFRKRFIPNECICLKNDVVLYHSDNLVVTGWKAIHLRSDMDHGYSAYFKDKGFKVSKFLKSDGSLLYWYCDIVEYDSNEEKSRLTTTDLLADVLILPDGQIQIVDLDELSQAHKEGLITSEQLYYSLNTLDSLLKDIYSGEFAKYTKVFDDFIQT